MAATSRTAAVLRAFAELTGAAERGGYDVTAGGHPLVWLGLNSTFVAQRTDPSGAARPRPARAGARASVQRRPEVERLAALDALHEHERLLREGWVYVVGTAAIRGERRRVCLPLVTRPVRLSRMLGALDVVVAGDLEVTPLIADADRAAELERSAEFGGGALVELGSTNPALLDRLPALTSWIRATAGAAGLPVGAVVAWTRPPATLRDREGLVAVVGAGLHLARDVNRPALADLLRDWARTPDIDATAFGHLYAAGADASTADAAPDPVESPLPLTAMQQIVVRRARHEPVVAVSGAPGNGKSHVVAAIAVDAVARGDSVLVATPSRYAADVIGDLLYREPGPDPVLFGSSARRRDLAADLADGVAAIGRAQERDAQRRRVEAAGRAADLRAAIVALLEREAVAQRLDGVEPLLPSLRRTAPGAFDEATDLEDLAALLRIARCTPDGVLDRSRRWLARRRLRRTMGHAVGTDDALLVRALDAARCVRASAALAVDGGTRIGARWAEVFAAERVAAERLGELLSVRAALARSADRRRARAVAALAAALRSGRATRREQLRRLDAGAVADALPLWVGALADVDDLLPPVAGMFDLLILDEASQIDQPRAASALLRARRAVVVGDPRQLRHVSFVSDAEQRRVLESCGIADATEQLDVRRMSAFDATAAVTPTSFLAEHHRSVPHLIAFSSRRFYGGRVQLRTRHPATETLDAITVVRVDARASDGIVTTEVTRVAAVLDELAASGASSIGVVSPFRAQTDALERMVLDRLSLEEIDALGLRVGTAHAFQGAERDVVVMSLGLTDGDSSQRRRFVEDPNLFNVLITRARRRIVVVTALTDAGDGLLGEYLVHAERPPSAPTYADSAAGWPGALADELRRQGATVRLGYRVGRHVVDLVVGEGATARAVDCRVHPDGPDAHVALRRTLHDEGWDVVEAWPSGHDGDVIRAALEVLPRT